MAKTEAKSSTPRTASSRLEALKKQQELQSNNFSKYKWLLAVGVVCVLIIGVFGGYMAGQQSSNDNQGGATKTDQIERSVSGKGAQQDREDAAQAALSIINNSKTDGDLQTRLNLISKGDFSSIPAPLVDSIRFADVFETDKEFQAVTYQSLLTLNSVAFKGQVAKIEKPELVQNSVYLDEEAGMAFVPVGLFTGTNVPFSFEMVYVDGAWKLAPYSLIESIRMSSMYNGQGTPGSDQTGGN